MIEPASPTDFAAIADLNVRAYEEFAPRLGPGGWDTMQKNLRNVAERAATARFLVVRYESRIVSSVAYCPAGKGDPAVFLPDMASLLLLAVDPARRGRGLAKELAAECIRLAERDGARSIGLFTSELMLAAQRIYGALGFHRETELPMRHGVRYFRYVRPIPASLVPHG